jgi:hypothetical protein
MDATAFVKSLGLGPAVVAPSRASGFANMLEAMRRRARMLVADLPTFPTLRITAEALVPEGAPRAPAFTHPRAQAASLIAVASPAPRRNPSNEYSHTWSPWCDACVDPVLRLLRAR